MDIAGAFVAQAFVFLAAAMVAGFITIGAIEANTTKKAGLVAGVSFGLSLLFFTAAIWSNLS